MFKVTCYIQKGLGGLRAEKRRYGPSGHIEENQLGYFNTYAQAADKIAKKCGDRDGNGHAHSVRSW